MDSGVPSSERIVHCSRYDSRTPSPPRVQPELSLQPSPPRGEEEATVCPATPVNVAARDLKPGKIPKEACGESPSAQKKVPPLGSPPARMMGQSHPVSQGASYLRLSGSSSASLRVGNKSSKNLSLSSRGGGPSKQAAKRSSLFSSRPIQTKGQKEPYLKAPRTRVSLPFKRPESFFLDKIPDVDSEGKEITPGSGSVYSELNSVMTSVWTPRRKTLATAWFCPGCTAGIWRCGEASRDGRGFWCSVYEEAINDGYSSRLSLAYYLVLERDMRDNYVTQAHHTCEYGPRIALCFNSFGCSAAFQWRAGLNSHALRLQLRVGLLLPFICPCHSYESSVRLDIPCRFTASLLTIGGRNWSSRALPMCVGG